MSLPNLPKKRAKGRRGGDDLRYKLQLLDFLFYFLHVSNLKLIRDANHTEQSPIRYNAIVLDNSLSHGISTNIQHIDVRTKCVRKFIQSFKEHVLVKNHISVSHSQL